MIPSTWLSGAIGGLALAGAAYTYGDSNGANRVIARNAKAEAATVAAMQKAQAAIEALSGAVAASQRDQSSEQRVIHHEATRIIERQSAAMCVDAGGVGLFDKARANANRPIARLPYDLPAGATEGPSQ